MVNKTVSHVFNLALTRSLWDAFFPMRKLRLFDGDVSKAASQ